MCARCGVGMLPVRLGLFFFFFFFFNDTATTEIYTLSLHDALPIWEPAHERRSTPISQMQSLCFQSAFISVYRRPSYVLVFSANCQVQNRVRFAIFYFRTNRRPGTHRQECLRRCYHGIYSLKWIRKT